MVYIVNGGSNVINDAKLSIKAVATATNKGLPLIEASFLLIVLKMAYRLSALPTHQVPLTLMVFSRLPLPSLDNPGLRVGVLVVAPTPTAGGMTVQPTVMVNNTTGGGKPLVTTNTFTLSIGPASFTVVGYIPKARGQVTAFGLNSAETAIVNASQPS